MPATSPLSLVPSRAFVRKTLLTVAAATTAAQVTVASAIVAADLVRKRRSQVFDPFPVTNPATDAVAENDITTYTFGEHLFADMIAAIEGARDVIYFESYIWKADEVGHQFRSALLAAAKRGVDVYVIYDGFANLVVPRDFYQPLTKSAHVLQFPVLRPGMLGLNPRYSGRDHRKILVVDGEVGFVGGFNIGDLYATRWRDTHLRIEGPAVWELGDAFADFWNSYRRKRHPTIHDTGARTWEASVRAHRNTPSQMLFPVRGIYLDAINRAQSHIHITQGYFIPDKDILEALLAARRRDVKVQVIIPEVSNHVLADWAARGYYDEMLAAGIELWLYQGAMIHAKTATVDGHWTTVGSANIDRLSLTGNFEINMTIINEDLADHMEDIFRTDLTRSRRLTPEEWTHRGLLIKFSEHVMGTLRPLL